MTSKRFISSFILLEKTVFNPAQPHIVTFVESSLRVSHIRLLAPANMQTVHTSDHCDLRRCTLNRTALTKHSCTFSDIPMCHLERKHATHYPRNCCPICVPYARGIPVQQSTAPEQRNSTRATYPAMPGTAHHRLVLVVRRQCRTNASKAQVVSDLHKQK